ncbi:MAG: division/cell wall cluster transcriptional repressor MraZ [Oscillospiraceae bacterium]|nr:division/cell wall cluster transcriptional repressor MraZ [Oscillospiraceae bacterium]
MFEGCFTHVVDGKGRVNMPQPFRDGGCDRFKLTVGAEGCLYAYDMGGWARILEAIGSLPTSDEHARNAQRLIIGLSATVEADTHGRVLIPQMHREMSGIQRNVVFIGAANRIEVWAQERWEAQFGSPGADYRKVYEELQRYGC